MRRHSDNRQPFGQAIWGRLLNGAKWRQDLIRGLWLLICSLMGQFDVCSKKNLIACPSLPLSYPYPTLRLNRFLYQAWSRYCQQRRCGGWLIAGYQRDNDILSRRVIHACLSHPWVIYWRWHKMRKWCHTWDTLYIIIFPDELRVGHM